MIDLILTKLTCMISDLEYDKAIREQEIRTDEISEEIGKKLIRILNIQITTLNDVFQEIVNLQESS